ncbi:MAG: hypothetical protein PWP51_2630 [Clostridiales bacterium]|jgi:uridine kinase|nr:hypothetical protein [Clostridiales bacterium]MDN5300077.1 hypothetical protein [Clostridiales bacterium]
MKKSNESIALNAPVKRKALQMPPQFKDVRRYLKEQADLHPSMQPQDMIKLCYQITYGAEHLLTDYDAAKHYFDREVDQIRETAENGMLPIFERISDHYCRVNLVPWCRKGLPPEWLFRMFADTMRTEANDGYKQTVSEEPVMDHLFKIIEWLVEKSQLPFSNAAWVQALNDYRDAGGGAVHHSDAYRAAEMPSYRLVNVKYMRLMPLLEKLNALPEKREARIIAIDGRSASGKSTMADHLANVLNAGVIHMDDFFLPAELRTAERLSEPGGNVHYERFQKEVLMNIQSPQAFDYQTFDCSVMKPGVQRIVKTSKWRIVEGAYSHHPIFGDYCDIRVFSDVTPDEQLRRIEKRNGSEWAKVFADKWIPMEEQYFKHFGLPSERDLLL